MNAKDYSFGREHRLGSRKVIECLFAEGRSFFSYPLRCVWLVADPPPGKQTAPVQVLVSVSKRNHKRAVARNQLKRRIREAYRLNRPDFDLPVPEGKCLYVAFIYSSKEILDYSTINHGVVKFFREIRQRLQAGGDLSVRAAD